MKNISLEDRCDEQTFLVNGRRRRVRVEVIASIANSKILASSAVHVGYVELPGGGMDKGENPIQTAEREGREEAGWTLCNLKVYETSDAYVYVAPEGSWLKENNYDEESTCFVIGNVTKYSPTNDLNSQGDAARYELLPIDQVIRETKEVIEANKDERGVHIAKARLTVLEDLFGKSRPVVEHLKPPLYEKW